MQWISSSSNLFSIIQGDFSTKTFHISWYHSSLRGLAVFLRILRGQLVNINFTSHFLSLTIRSPSGAGLSLCACFTYIPVPCTGLYIEFYVEGFLNAGDYFGGDISEDTSVSWETFVFFILWGDCDPKYK